ncbi:MAG: insulinase family protein [Deltaproteobacteria bacterium]|nr:insulinase family protein [Deltaproteobacteria bacterium]
MRVKALGLALIAVATAACREAPLDLERAPVVAAPPAPIDLAAVVPDDPDLREGALPNGVRFDILPVPGALRTQVWLVVGAGSLAEDDDQRGLAHLVEHLAFEGTTHFPGHAIRDVVERSGMASGDDLNATTSYDATTYKLAVPGDDPALLATGLDVLRDWASEVTFDPAAIDHERKVVAEERRLRAGDGGFDEAVRDYVLRGSRHAERFSSGDPIIVATAPREALLRFYRDWYRPDLMTVIVVGDVDAAAVEAQIRSRFAGLVGPAQPRALPHDEIHVRDGEVVIARNGQTDTAVIEQLPANPERTYGDLRQRVIELLRMRALTFAGDVSDWTEHRRFGDVWCYVERSGWPEVAIERLVKARRGVLDPAAIARARREFLEEGERFADGVADPAELVDELATRAVTGGWFIDADQYARATAQLVPTILDAEIATRPRAPVAILVHRDLQLDDDDQVTKLHEDGIREDFAAAIAGTFALHPPRDPRPAVDLPRVGLSPGTIVAERTITTRDGAPRSWIAQVFAAHARDRDGHATRRSLGPGDLLEWRLSNDARVLVKPLVTPGHAVSILGLKTSVAGLAPGDETATVIAGALISGGGPGVTHEGFARAALAAGVPNHVADTRDGGALVYADARTSAHVEAALQVVDAYMRATAPGDEMRDAVFAAASQGIRSDAPAGRWLLRDLDVALTDGDPLVVGPTREEIKRIDTARALAIYRDRFGDASAFTFVITGDVDPAALRPLVEKYLAGLPATGAPPIAPPPARSWHAGDQTIVRHGGGGDRATIHVTAWSTATGDYGRKRDLLLLQLLLQARVRDLLRDELAEVYAVDVDVSLTAPPAPKVAIAIDFSCAPAHAQALATAVRALLDQLRDGAITADDSARAIAQVRRTYEGWVGDTTYWQQELASRALYGLDPAGIATDPRRVVADLELARTRAIVRELLSLGGTVTGILLPQ